MAEAFEAEIPKTPSTPSNDDWLAYAALVLGLTSCLLSCLTGVPAIVLGAISYRRASPTARPFGMVGLVLGVLTTLLMVVTILLVGVTTLLGQSLVGDFEDVRRELDAPRGFGDAVDDDEPADDT